MPGKRGPAKLGICIEDGQEAPIVARQMCRKHYVSWYRNRQEGPACGAESCTVAAYSNGYCAKHYGRLARYGATGDEVLQRRPQNGDRWVDRHGYVRVRSIGHPNAHRGGWMLEHRLVMEKILGRYLRPEENVHHKNGLKGDNRPENLELWVVSQPSGQRIPDVVAWAKEILARYEGEAELLQGR